MRILSLQELGIGGGGIVGGEAELFLAWEELVLVCVCVWAMRYQRQFRLDAVDGGDELWLITRAGRGVGGEPCTTTNLSILAGRRLGNVTCR